MEQTILLVDDELSIVETVQEILDYEGFLVVPATDPRQALSLAERTQPALVVTDFMMPGLNGVQLLGALRARPALAQVPAVLMSAVDVRFLGETPVWDVFLRKPFEVEALLAAVSRALVRSR